uniref:Uncharacterized protein n=1 Tax=Dactylellina haptotyla TaxID=430498 RepID=B2BK84_9PEZI|nr:hypothetical protein [Dactylellina haptotyla]
MQYKNAAGSEITCHNSEGVVTEGADNGRHTPKLSSSRASRKTLVVWYNNTEYDSARLYLVPYLSHDNFKYRPAPNCRKIN